MHAGSCKFMRPHKFEFTSESLTELGVGYYAFKLFSYFGLEWRLSFLYKPIRLAQEFDLHNYFRASLSEYPSPVSS